RLVADGLAQHIDERRGVGRPRRIWSLTERAQARFPDTHAQLTLEMLDARREAQTAAAYATALAELTSLEARVARLTEIRTAEGYMAEWSSDPGGGFL